MALMQWEPMGLEWPERWRKWLDAESEGWMKVEEIQEDGTLVVRAELPGLDPDKDVDVSVSDGVLHISAKREERNEKKDKGTYRSEFRYGEFSRDLALPSGWTQAKWMPSTRTAFSRFGSLGRTRSRLSRPRSRSAALRRAEAPMKLSSHSATAIGRPMMTTCEQVSAARAGEASIESGEVQKSASRPVVDGFIDQIFDVIFGLTKGRPSQSDGDVWVSFDTAIRGLHGAIVALEAVGGSEPRAEEARSHS